MSEEEKQSPIQESVLESIKKHRVNMHSRLYFMLQGMLAIIAAVIVFCALLYLASFIAFALLETGVWFVPVFGIRGWIIFFRSLPWILILLTLLFVLVLEVMVRRYPFAYRRPVLYSLLGIVGLVLFGGMIISRAHFHRQFMEFSRVNHVPMVGGFYRWFERLDANDFHKGIVRFVATSSFVIEGPQGETSTVFVNSAPPFFWNQLVPSDTVVVIGDQRGQFIQAMGVKSIGHEY